MKQKKIKIMLSVLMSALICVTSASSNLFPVVAQATTSSSQSSTSDSEDDSSLTDEEKREAAKQKLEEQISALEADLKECEEKIAQFSEDSKTTEEYINALDEKIGIINQQLTALDEQVQTYEEEIEELQLSIDENQTQADALQQEIDETQENIDALNETFMAMYDDFCIRMRALYISGDFSIITALFTCKDISSLLTRYEMIQSVSENDAELMQEIQEQVELILEQEEELNEKKTALEDTNTLLLSQQTELEAKQAVLTAAQEEIAAKKITLAQDKAESDELFALYTATTGMYTEYRNEDAELTAAAEQELEDLMNGILSPDEISDFSIDGRDYTPSVSYTDTDVYNKSDGVYNMTYPVPGYYTISAGFPNYSNGSYHGGIDFPCSTGTSVVAAQKGVVAGVKYLDYSYGYYVLIYHGTDADGNKVFTLYAHNSEILVSVGDTVYKGQEIAKSGSTGNSTGPHCHFEIRVGGTRVNPTNYLSK